MTLASMLNYIAFQIPHTYEIKFSAAINSLRPSDAYMRLQAKPLEVQTMAWRQTNTGLL